MTNTVIGYVISVAVGQVIYPMFGYHITIVENMGLTIIFVTVSLFRAYLFRRFFEKYRHHIEAFFERCAAYLLREYRKANPFPT